MPKETFWDSSTAVEGDESEPILTVGWGSDNPPSLTLNDVEFDRSGINRLIQTLVKARNATFGLDAAPEVTARPSYGSGMDIAIALRDGQ